MKTLATLLGTAFLYGCATQLPVNYDTESLDKVDLRSKTVQVYFEPRGETFIEHETAIKDFVKDFYAKQNIKIHFSETEQALDYDSIKVLGLNEQDYVAFVEERGGDDDHDAGTAYFSERITVIKEETPPTELEPRQYGPLHASVSAYLGTTIVHEIGHLLGLYHPSSVRHTKIPFYWDSKGEFDPVNIMFYRDVGSNIKLSYTQKKQLHSFLGKGRVYDIIEEAKQEQPDGVLNWYTNKIESEK